MAGRGPAPKDVRRRGNAPARGDWVDLGPLLERVLPDLPEHEEFSERTRQAWELWADDPATQMYGPSDIANAIDLAYLHNDWVNGGGAKAATEVRQRMDALGLTAKGKRDLRWRVAVAVEGDVDEGAAEQEPAAASVTRRHLRAV